MINLRKAINFLLFLYASFAYSGELSQWKKFPVVSVPLIESAPVIDGIVEKREWFAAAKISSLVDYYTGLKTEDNTFVYLAYDQEKFYVAFQFERPANARIPRADVDQRDKGLGQDDVFEMLLDVEHKHTRYFDFGGNVRGVFWDGIGKPNVDKSWNANWQYKARTTHWGWEGEIAIAFEDFGLKTPSPGTVWGADFVRNERTPVDRLALWSFRGKNWHKFTNFGHLIFSGEPLTISLEQSGWLDQQAGVQVRLSNFSHQAKWVKCLLEIRKAETNPGEYFYPAVENALTEDLGFAILANLEQEIENNLKPYPVVKREEKEVEIAAGRSDYLSFSVPAEPGHYLVVYRLAAGERILTAALTPFKVTLPLAIRVEFYPYSSGTMFYQVDLKRLTQRLRGGVSLEVSLIQEGKILTRKEVGVDSREQIRGEFHLKKPVGTYLVKASLKEGTTTLAENSEPVIVPETPGWLGNQIGKRVAVPEPWTPVRAKKDTCEVWGRKFSWKQDNFLPEIEVLSQPILARPIEFGVKNERGEKITWKSRHFHLVSQAADQATYQFKLSTDRLTVQGKETVEFDGMVWLNLEIVPSFPQEIKAVYLEIPLKKEFAKLYTCGEPLSGDRLAEKLTGLIPPEGFSHRFTYAAWIGNEELGVQWFAENDRNWFLTNQEKAIEVIPQTDKTVLRINFVEGETKLSQGLQLSFGLIPTPTRPKPENWSDWHFFQYAGTFPRVTEEIRQKEPKSAWKWERNWKWIDEGGLEKDGVTILIFHGSSWTEIFGYPGTFNEEKKKLLKEWVALCHKKNIKVLVYTGWGVSIEGPEWKDFGKEMVRLPLKNTGYATYRQCPASLFTDWFLYKCQELIKEFDIDGLFLDSTASLSECNGAHGCGWQDREGRLRSSFPIRKTRELFRRLFTLFHQEGKKDGLIYSHQSPPAIMPIESFEDVRCGGEFAQFYQGEFDEKYLGYVIAKLGGQPYGLFSEMANKNWMNPPVKVNEVLAIAVPLNISLKTQNAFAIQDYSLLGEPMPKIHQAWRWVEASKAWYLPWWKNQAFISLNPKEQVISALWVKKREKALVCISNLSREKRKLAAEIKLDSLGLQEVEITDAITEEKIEKIAGKIFLEIEGRRYRLLKIYPAKP
ncbi:MAG: DUF6067 family protein [Candidatus Omnitrophica bacterium]|nr:DUF6067 family protein [Candidatus Omnitrophota bacterium]